MNKILFCFRMLKLLTVLIICKEKNQETVTFPNSILSYIIVKLWHNYTMSFFEENSSEKLEFKTSYKESEV